MEPVVRARSTRRRRSEPPALPAPATPPTRTWLIYIGLISLVAVLMVEGFLSHSAPRATLPDLSQATEVRSAISQLTDSLQVVVSWDLTLSDSAGRPDSIRVRVLAELQEDTLVSMQVADQFADTINFPSPAVGQTVSGLSCVAAEHPGKTPEEACTPWQYVRPAAAEEAAGTVLAQIIIQPTGLQVDPDIDGTCARWQQDHPSEPVWIVVNHTAVPECTGPNRKPTVAQFCAFAVLPDGRRVKVANSANNPYCEELFVEWIRERFS